MTPEISEAASTMLLLSRWRFLIAEDQRHRVKRLRADAERCFQLAHGGASAELAAELEAIGRDFEREAGAITTRVQAAAYQICYPGFRCQKQPKASNFQQLMGARFV